LRYYHAAVSSGRLTQALGRTKLFFFLQAGYLQSSRLGSVAARALRFSFRQACAAVYFDRPSVLAARARIIVA
jgi:hypothetical protein